MEYPDINRKPEAIFSSVVPSINSKTQNSFVLSSKEFFFGYQITQPPKTGNQSSAFSENISHFPAEITLYDTTKTIFSVFPLSVTIRPHETSQIIIAAHPTVPGTFKSEIVILIKENPITFILPIVIESCNPNIEIPKPVFDFPKVLCNQSSTQTIQLVNNGKIAAYWRIKTPV
jgi:hypothetical protein